MNKAKEMVTLIHEMDKRLTRLLYLLLTDGEEEEEVEQPISV